MYYLVTLNWAKNYYKDTLRDFAIKTLHFLILLYVARSKLSLKDVHHYTRAT